ncbi:Acetate operon repressor [Variovorax sp. PBS-H4]|uniref:IclR family transcriptional regulator n=1 Tax=Variovorax sp. PBS-H4 TaxID=434008 RepID=UPI001318130F|nr:IclR family transcriptional regulator [Variovorax sp. PBS-H4]VTU36445.1 Acetate operon repressor [Variovorax sp. PBS-H4]
MSGVMQRTLAILDCLADNVGGMQIGALADRIGIPISAAHRLLAELAEHGWVRQSRERGEYVLTTRLVSLGLTYLKNSGIIDLCQPVLDTLAEASGELVRLGVVDVDHLTWVAKSQGARSGLRYDPDMGVDAQLSCTATGFAWLSTLPESDAIALVSAQGLPAPGRFGPRAPTSMNAVMKAVRQARKQGFAIAVETYTVGLAAISAPIIGAHGGAVGVLAISGPSARLTQEKMLTLVAPLLAATADLAAASSASPLFDRAFNSRELETA